VPCNINGTDGLTTTSLGSVRLGDCGALQWAVLLLLLHDTSRVLAARQLAAAAPAAAAAECCC
jgi:hypothetical protein